MKINELKKLTNEELEKKSRELGLELIKSLSSKSGGKTKQIKKMLARIKTIQSSKSGGKK